MNRTMINPKMSKQDLLNYLADLTEVPIKNNTISISLDDYIAEKTKDIPDPIIEFTPQAYIAMMNIVHHTSKEIAWHGLVKKKDSKYIIYNILVYPQIITTTTVDSDEELYPEWIIQQAPHLNKMRMQGHSHVNMGVSPSGTDLTYYEDMLTQIDDFYIFLIVNKSQDLHVRFYDIENNILFINPPCTVQGSSQSIQALKKVLKENVKEKSYTVTTYGYRPEPYEPPTYKPPIKKGRVKY